MRVRPPDAPALYDAPTIAAVKALYAGTANASQQKLALEWILMDVCGVRNEQFVAGQPDVTSFLMGRRNVGLQIVRLTQLRPGRVDPRGPPPPMPGEQPAETTETESQTG